MCGIFGIVGARPQQHSPALAAMRDVLHHRGPDGTGIEFLGGCALGHTRLSIVDLAGGNQPMRSAVAAHTVTFNGEIYGFRDIRSRLDSYPFRTQSDTEVILALYARYGEPFVEHLPGMFAFALWDESKQTLICARDRFGEKPFYYALTDDGMLVFASEIKSILASGLITPKLRSQAVAHFLQRLYVSPDETIYQNVHVLPPAHRLIWCEGSLSISRYWSLPAQKDRMALADAAERFLELMNTAVAKQLVADVPVGAFLSGGLDSSTIVALAARHTQSVTTISFDFSWGSEVKYAREVAAAYRTNHIEVKEEGHDIADLLMQMQTVYDEPFADPSAIPTFLVCRAARKYLKVVLAGDGGDELLAGYTYWYRPLLDMQERSSRDLRLAGAYRVMAALARRLRLRMAASLSSRAASVRLLKAHGTVARAHHHQNTYFSDGDLKALGLEPPPVPDWARWVSNTVDDALRMDLENYLPGDILVKTDRASMANSLELRAPFLDVDLASFCIGLPASLKIDSKADKLVLRAACQNLWPASVRHRGKQGFATPVDNWLRQDGLVQLGRQYLDRSSAKLYEVLPYERTRRFASGETYHKWVLLVLALWLETRLTPVAGQSTLSLGRAGA